MLIGILSDTHDRVDTMAAGMQALRDAGAVYYIHCGDVGSERVLDYLVGVPSAFVFGNCDWDRAALQRYAADVGVTCYGNFGDIELAGKRIALLHGDDAKLLQRLVTEQRHDYILLGHTHVRQDTRTGRTRIINPGALHRAKVKTVALLDTGTDVLRFLTLDEAA